MKKRRFIIVLSVVMALLMVTIPSLQIAAADIQNNVEYISEVKIGVGKTADEAEKALEGYTILKDGNSYVDLNQKAGGGIGSKGERVVYLGYKTTTERTEAITDLAVMNMKGGYSVKDYELLMEQYMTEQIIPFVNNFLATINEYRENYNSDNEENKARAQYVHDALNKLTDDDCGGAGLGDLLLNETKYEMGDASYDALSEEEKKNHADIVTIITQANGKATFMIENLITRAADTNEDTWIDRFAGTTYEDLLTLYSDMLPSEAEAQLARDYDNDAREILSMWSALKERLDQYDESVQKFDELAGRDLSAQQKIAEEFDLKNATEEQAQAFAQACAEITVSTDIANSRCVDIFVVDYLSGIEYRDGTLADFFKMSYETVEKDIKVIYPLVASLTEGQRAGLQFVTLSDLIMISATDAEGYNDASYDDTTVGSIYDGVDRDIYKKGGVALTSEAMRTHSAEEIESEGGQFSILSYILVGTAAVSTAAFVGTAVFSASDLVVYLARRAGWNEICKAYKSIIDSFPNPNTLTYQEREAAFPTMQSISKNWREVELKLYNEDSIINGKPQGIVPSYLERSAFCNKLLIGFGIAATLLSAAALYSSYRDLVDYYNVDYTPIPHYMVDEKDITTYNEKGEKEVIKNQAAYYKVVETNRAESDEWFNILGTSADLNGTVGRQWLALYAAKNENEVPIVASSLKAVVGKDDVPPDYTTGIHMFGSDAAFNFNNTNYVWNNNAPSVFVYFNVDGSAQAEPSTAGTSFSAGYLVLTGVIGLVVGAGLGALVMLSSKRKKTEEA